MPDDDDSDPDDQRFWIGAGLMVLLCIALVVGSTWWVTHYGRPDDVYAVRAIDDRWVVLHESGDGWDEAPSFDRIVVIDARTSEVHALQTLDHPPIAITPHGVWAWHRDDGFTRWTLPDLDPVDPAVPGLSAALADENPCVDEELELIRVVTTAGDHLTLSLLTGERSASEPQCGRDLDAPEPARGDLFVDQPDSERKRLREGGGPGWLDPELPGVDVGIAPDLAILYRSAVDGPLALTRVSPSGDVRWVADLGEITSADHAVPIAGSLVVAGSGRTFAVDLASGAVRWQR